MKIPHNRFKKLIYRLTNHPYFEIFIMGCILLNTIVFLINWDRAPVQLDLVT